MEVQVVLDRKGTQTWNLTSNFLFKWSNKWSAVKTTMSASEMKSSMSRKFHTVEISSIVQEPQICCEVKYFFLNNVE